ncbi:glycosyltransferase family 2 protein [Bacteroides gallinaceum]|uniref:glycosyltransferase family 2 protein n=1 Tax=Bacteroides gallinaceum TaxID=1462571 RepID=UPI0025A3BD41|nr:glycosyltransferase family 2 protein [Bacteroides gallinaceum]MDM8153164.1 glycosyltransferase family 2 protein [Bacteroides gallinaceum]
MKNPIVSVIVPIYNVESYLSQCLDSILKQSFVDFEVIMVDDGSKDKSGVICDEYAAKDSRINVFHQSNQGVSKARNVALNHAKGEYVIFMDADDFWYVDTCLETLVNEALRTGADIVRGEYKAVDEQGNDLFARKINRRKMKLAYRLVSSATFLKDVIQGEFFLVLSLIKADKVSQIRFRKGQVFLEDMDFYARLMLQPLKCVFVPCRFYAYRKYAQSASSSLSMKRFEDSFLIIGNLKAYATNANDSILKKTLGEYSVLMYYWGMGAIADSCYANRFLIINRLNLKERQQEVKKLMWKYRVFNRASIFVLLPPIMCIPLMRYRNCIIRLGKHALSKFLL